MDTWTRTDWLLFTTIVMIGVPIASRIFFLYLEKYIRWRRAKAFTRSMEERMKRHQRGEDKEE